MVPGLLTCIEMVNRNRYHMGQGVINVNMLEFVLYLMNSVLCNKLHYTPFRDVWERDTAHKCNTKVCFFFRNEKHESNEIVFIKSLSNGDISEIIMVKCSQTHHSDYEQTLSGDYL